MGFFDRIFGNRRVNASLDSFFKTFNAYNPVFYSWQGGLYESEVVRAAINAVATHVSKMSVQMVGAAKQKLQTKMQAAPNEFQTWSQFLYRTATILLVNNTAFIVPVLDEFDEISGVYTVVPSRCELVQSNGVPYLRYYFKSGDSGAIELERCGILTKFQYADDFKGETNAALDATMALLDIQNQGIREGVKSAATYRFMATLNNFSKAEDIAKERKRFSSQNLATDADGGGILLFPNTYTNVQQIKSQPYIVDAEQMKLINTNVFNYFGVNEKILQNNATSDEMDAFYNGALEPFAIQLAEVLSKMFYSYRERNSGNAVYVTSDRLQYMSVQNKVAMVTQLGDRGMMTINEARHLFNYAPLPEGNTAPIRGEYYMLGDERNAGEN